MSCTGGPISPVGGRLWQWDVGRSVRVPAGAEAVHFAPAGSSRALAVEPRDGLAEVPNLLLQQPRDIACWAVAGGRTTCRAVLAVCPRAKPDDYLYTPTEVQRWEDVEEWVRGQLAQAGEPGTKWYVGDGAPSVGGRVGDLYLDSATGRYYRYGEREQ